MRDVYSRVTQLARAQVYPFMKNHRISPLSYHFRGYFDACLEEYHIKIMPHHFSNRKIEGLTMVDKAGITFSYEKENPVVKQNFTLCHELGHYILEHSGQVFTEMAENSDSPVESEANLFSAVVLMPDIVLLSKIYYRRDNFRRVMTDLSVSAEALTYRLLDLFRYYLSPDHPEISPAIVNYKSNQNHMILSLFEWIHDKIEADYKAVEEDVLWVIRNKLMTNEFVTSRDFPELLDDSFRKELMADDSVGAWVVFDFGQALGYAWRKDKLTEQQAKSRANTMILLEKR